MSDVSAGDKEIRSHNGITFMAALTLGCAVFVFWLAFELRPSWVEELDIKLEHFGQFGDYFGGVINPVVGLLTIVLLTNSLRQNREALNKANYELSLSRTAIDQNENALKKQISNSESANDMNHAFSLWKEYERQLQEDIDIYNAIAREVDAPEIKRYELADEDWINEFLTKGKGAQFGSALSLAKETFEHAEGMRKIIAAEEGRLLEKYKN